jgi:hypothetical protein
MTMRRLLAALIGLHILAVPAVAQARNPMPHTRTDGPAAVCGSAFAIRLVAGESVDREQGPDFSLFYVTAADGPFLLYEGGYPQPHDDEVRTGQDFPSVIAIHDNRSAEAKAHSRVRDRVLVGDAFHAACPQAARSH